MAKLVSVGRYMGGENPIMLRLVDLILRDCKRRDRRPDATIFVVAKSAPITDGRWWWDTGESFVKKLARISSVCIVCCFG